MLSDRGTEEQGEDREGEVPLEIERVYLLDRLPELPAEAVPYRIEQGYLPDPEEGAAPGTFYEGRLRRIVAPDGAVTCVHTVKRGAGLVREEEEHAISEEAFLADWPRTEHRRIVKTRYKVPAGGLTWEVDAFDGLPLVMAEVELPGAEAESPLPAWLAPHVVRELTEDPRYRNYALATEGLPEE